MYPIPPENNKPDVIADNTNANNFFSDYDETIEVVWICHRMNMNTLPIKALNWKPSDHYN